MSQQIGNIVQEIVMDPHRAQAITHSAEHAAAFGILAPLTNPSFRLPPLEPRKPNSAPRAPLTGVPRGEAGPAR
jgi:hypothetical protein